LLYKLDNDYQEAFAISIRGTDVTLFYAELPNQYLSRIAEFGVKYSETFPSEKVRLFRSMPFSMMSHDQLRWTGHELHRPHNPSIPPEYSSGTH
jgi:hypothetical protein